MSAEAYVVSDLHLGAGPKEPQLEDFEQDDAFVHFVDDLGNAKLFVAGDLVDFPQIPPYDVPATNTLLWNEAVSREKLRSAIDAHSACFDALARHIGRGGTISIIIGNHDLDFAWPEVQNDLRVRLSNASKDQLAFAIEHDSFHTVHIEHGHAFTPENCPRDPSHFIHHYPEKSGPKYLERVWGTDFMLGFFNDLERRYPYADNTRPTLTLLYHGLRQRWIGARELVRLMLFLKGHGIPWAGLASAVLAPDEPPTISDLLGSIGDVTWKTSVRDLSHDAAFKDALNEHISQLTPGERAILRRPVQVILDNPTPAEQPSPTLGMMPGREAQGASGRLSTFDATHVVMGHTHTIVNAALNGRFFNPGTWIPHLDLESDGVRARVERDGWTQELFSDKTLFVTQLRTVRIKLAGNSARLELISI